MADFICSGVEKCPETVPQMDLLRNTNSQLSDGSRPSFHGFHQQKRKIPSKLNI
jgi:hypothetical protein